jgi:ABC-2 type transport system ATP-binding protein
METMIEVRGLGKRYGPVEAVKDVSFSVGADQVLGFLGPNGAGKTTIMKILTGFHFPSSGTALVEGISVEENPLEVKQRIGYLPENVPLYGELTVEEYLNFIADARHIRSDEKQSRMERAIEACGLGDYRRRRIETLSKGYRQRAGLAQAILHDPPILILDEPTTGLDPNQIIEIRSLITRLGQSKTVILSTHIMQEVEAVCSQVLILNEGRIAAQGTPEEIALAIKGSSTWDLILKTPGLESLEPALARAPFGAKAALEPLAAAPGGSSGLVQLQLSLPGSGENLPEYAEAEAISDWVNASGFKILGMARKTLSLEDIFVKLTHEGVENE